jgi:voltage-gated sodium channel
MMNMIKNITESSQFQHFIMGIIILNGITMGFGASSYYSVDYNFFFELFNFTVVAIFTIEIIMRISVHKKSLF